MYHAENAESMKAMRTRSVDTGTARKTKQDTNIYLRQADGRPCPPSTKTWLQDAPIPIPSFLVPRPRGHKECRVLPSQHDALRLDYCELEPPWPPHKLYRAISMKTVNRVYRRCSCRGLLFVPSWIDRSRRYHTHVITSRPRPPQAQARLPARPPQILHSLFLEITTSSMLFV